MSRSHPDPATADLAARLAQRGWRPGRGEAARLFAALAAVDREEAILVERALARLGAEAAAGAEARWDAAPPRLRARLCRLVGRVAAEGQGDALRPWLLARLDDADAATRKAAAMALGRLGGPGVEAALLQALDRADGLPEQRALAAALGKVGGAEAAARLATVETDDPELARIAAEARLKIDRTEARAEAGRIDDARAPAAPLPVRLHCRAGLAPFAAEELASLGAVAVDPATVRLTLAGPLRALWQARTFLRFGFPLARPRAAPKGAEGLPPVGRDVVAALTSPAAQAIFAAFTDGPVRWRLEWADGGHRRGLTFRVVEALTRRAPGLRNDPTRSLWELVVHDGPDGAASLELWPRGLADPRFAWRVADVPASSHPTVAAALARLGGVAPDDVVWDPFVGAGAELIERARLGPLARLVGSDLDETALAAARANLAAAGVEADLVRGDARTFRPAGGPPSLILTNPPMGRRVGSRGEIGPLYAAFLAHAAALLAPGGRLAWISARPEATRAEAARHGLRLARAVRIDMGGFSAEMQLLLRPMEAAAHPVKRPRPRRV